ncbi:MAG: N-acetylmuramoyl-L-alanine amidase [Pelagibacterales bacterium]|nr:N-acetylmuramoyl-L-alanine amidase [Pelagibacterales bacterium]
MTILHINKEKKFTEFFDKADLAREIKFLVLHHIEAKSVDQAVEMLKKHSVSAHFLVDESGKIYELVEENNIAYHAGVSYWKGYESLNNSSIGIEFINSSPFSKKFEEAQIISGVVLCKYIAAKYKIEPRNIVGHSDIAYFKETGFLDRKQDPSQFFDWKFFANNNVGVFPLNSSVQEEIVLFSIGDKSSKILKIKENLAKFGYKVSSLNDVFDDEMKFLTRVFNRRFNPRNFEFNSDVWYLSSQKVLEALN